MALFVELNEKTIVITIDRQKAIPSASGKTLVVASTHGNVTTPVMIEGKPLVVGLNVYYKA